MTIRIISWNVNGIRSNIVCNGSLSKKIKDLDKLEEHSNLYKLIDEYNPDIMCFQETRCGSDIGKIFQLNEFPYKYWNSSSGEGARGCNRYSGVSIWSKNKAICEIVCPFIEEEGRFLMLEFPDFYLINVYVPNSGSNLEYRKNVWDCNISKLLYDYTAKTKPLIYTGDLNVVNETIDIYNDKHLQYANMPGCLEFERNNFKQLLKNNSIYKSGSESPDSESPDIKYIEDKYIDVYRELYVSKQEYTWWNMRTKSREKNCGWRLDYFLINNKFKNMIKDTQILCNIMGSDHCPILLDLDCKNEKYNLKVELNIKYTIPESWIEYFHDIPEIPKKSLPPPNMIFNAFKYFKPGDTRVVIIGQDPYHKKFQAHGLAFSVQEGIKIPPSLKNIYKELYNDLNIEIPTSGCLIKWAEEGVLLLNTALTVEEGKPGSHIKSKIWLKTTNTIITKLSYTYPDIIFILWGNYAIGKKKLINPESHIIEGGHPSPLNRKNKENFFDKKFFSKTNLILQNKEYDEINWKL